MKTYTKEELFAFAEFVKDSDISDEELEQLLKEFENPLEEMELPGGDFDLDYIDEVLENKEA
jgi:hypothetical protein